MLRKQPSLVQVDGRTCFKVDEGVIVCTEDDIASGQLFTGLQQFNKADVDIVLAEKNGSGTILAS